MQAFARSQRVHAEIAPEYDVEVSFGLWICNVATSPTQPLPPRAFGPQPATGAIARNTLPRKHPTAFDMQPPKLWPVAKMRPSSMQSSDLYCASSMSTKVRSSLALPVFQPVLPSRTTRPSG